MSNPCGAPPDLEKRLPYSDEPHLHLLESVTFRPVFILGLHRSGTTLLYRLLAMSGSFNLVTVYHLLHYNELLAHHLDHTEGEAKEKMNQRLKAQGLLTRVIDDTPVTADLPEEYGFHLSARTGRMGLNAKSLAAFDELCRKARYIGSADRPVLLKNPWDFWNFQYIHSMYPDARFVFIHRHPLDIVNSQIRALRSSWQDSNPFLELLSEKYLRVQKFWRIKWLARCVLSPREPLHIMRRLLVKRFMSLQDYYRRKIVDLPAEVYTAVRYEELCRDPQGHTEAVLGFLGLRPAVVADYRGCVKCRPRRLEPDIEPVQARLCRQLGCALEQDGYSA